MAHTDSTVLPSPDIERNDDRLHITPAPSGGLALRTSTEPASQALVISEVAFRAFVHDILKSTADELLTHPDWCLRTESPGGRHRSRELWASLPGEETCTRFWTIQDPGDAAPTLLFAVEEEDYDRKTLRLNSEQAVRLAEAADHLDRTAVGATGVLADDEHPYWCTGVEEVNEPHRSERLAISADDDLQGIWMYLGCTRSTGELLPATTSAWLEIREDSHSNIWILAPHQLPLIRYAVTEALQWQGRATATDRQLMS
ncbi:hypothetical protein ACIA8K_29800 [Catenuloplanes sp. NPDC051500]|uniref:hypothetical protein n=1 Tax=Catenuloplanes sp. NPDC051500 TaxID=3363959 RepID=UPI0037B59DA8